MDKPSNTFTTLKIESIQSAKPVPSSYPDSVRMTAQRLAYGRDQINSARRI